MLDRYKKLHDLFKKGLIKNVFAKVSVRVVPGRNRFAFVSSLSFQPDYESSVAAKKVVLHFLVLATLTLAEGFDDEDNEYIQRQPATFSYLFYESIHCFIS